MKINVRGVEAAVSTIERKAQQNMEKLSQTVHDSAIKIQLEAKWLAPVRTGNLMNSILYEPQSKLLAYVRASASYSAFVEYGTSKQRAQPYMRPAVEKEKQRLRGLKFRVR